MQPAVKNTYDKGGYAVLPNIVDACLLEELRRETDQLLASAIGRGGVRNALAKSELFRGVAESGPPFKLASLILGSGARATKLTIFDKTATANWKVPWHQDLTIAVKERRDAPGFGPWTTKDGTPHVQPPVAVLEQTLAVRLHLDDTPPENGGLRVLPGSHALGRLSDAQIAHLRTCKTEASCSVPAGGAMLMSPLLLHASSAATSPSRRRVLHFEYSTASLPEDLAWP